MTIFRHFSALTKIANELAELVGVGKQTNQLLQEAIKQMANINDTLAGIKTRLTEATTELLALIEQLRSEQLTPEGRENLAAIETGVNALADVVQGPEKPQ